MSNKIFTFCQEQVKLLDQQKQQREIVIDFSRKILLAAKKAIFALHDNDYNLAQEKITLSLELARTLEKKVKNRKALAFDGSWQAAIEELSEAFLFDLLIKNKTFKPLPLKSVPAQVYLAALADVSGELVRRAVLLATNNNSAEVDKCCLTAKEIVNGLTNSYLSGHLRQKSDEAKRNIKRLEQIRYEMSLYKN